MRMSETYYNLLSDRIGIYDTERTRDAYIRGEIANAEKVQDLDKRYRWDLFWMANRILSGEGVTLPADLNDSHIETALKKIVKVLD